ncbi:anthranilate phosphoribosyltransferase [Myroides sp. LJL119]
MKQILNQLIQGKTLSYQTAKQILLDIAKDKYSAIQTSALLTCFCMRAISLEELKGFREAMLELCISVDLSEFNPMDLCGTGGDNKDTFNISTLASFIVAGAGIPVAKHGNYGVSSISGSSSVMENLGIKFTANPEKLKQQLSQANICFLHAPLFHPAMKTIGPIRKELAVRTFFNILGPLTNPAQPKVQLIGLSNLEVLRIYQYFLQQSNTKYSIIHALDGYDECSLTQDCKIVTNSKETIISPSYFNMPYNTPESIKSGRTAEDSAYLFWQILKAKGTQAQNNVVLANSALAIKTYYPNYDMQTALSLAKESLYTGKAKEKFEILREL